MIVVRIFSSFVLALEALRKSGNLELKRDFFFSESLVVKNGKISYAEVLQ